MFIEMLDPRSRTAIFEGFFEITKQALVEVFSKSDDEANGLIADLLRKFSDAPMEEQNMLLHNDPVALASELAEVPWSNVQRERLDSFSRKRQPFRSTIP